MSITERVTSIRERHEKVSELEVEADEINARREAAKQKNNALRSLGSKLEDLQSDYKTLRKWQSLAEAMSVSYDTDAVSRLVGNIEKDLRTITNTDFEGFDDAQEIRDLEEDFDAHHKTLDERQRNIQQCVEKRCEDLLEELSTKRTVLRIPDVGSEKDEELIQDFQEFLQYHNRGNLQRNPAARYEELEDEYANIEISFEAVQEEYEIGDEAMEELRKLLNNEQVTLSEIDEDVLNDLKNLHEFSRLLTIQFTGEK